MNFEDKIKQCMQKRQAKKEQKERMKEGLIPSMNDLGAWHAAQQTLDKYGKDAVNE